MEWGVPLLAMMYTRGKKFVSEYDVEGVKHAARIAGELGADIAKVNYTGSIASFRQVIEGCPIPVVIAGGERAEDPQSLLLMIKESLEAGGAGVSVGRNVFQHDRPGIMMEAISKIVHDNASVAEALAILESRRSEPEGREKR
jgi:DhnA family fructose-bisphosphate aldolase class Ia